VLVFIHWQTAHRANSDSNIVLLLFSTYFRFSEYQREERESYDSFNKKSIKIGGDKLISFIVKSFSSVLFIVEFDPAVRLKTYRSFMKTF